MDLDEEESPESETEEEPKGEEKAAHLGVFQEHFYTYLRRALGSSGAPKKLVDALHFCKHANKVNISVPAVDDFDPSKSHPDTCLESPADRRTAQAPEGLAPTTSSVASLRAYTGAYYIYRRKSGGKGCFSTHKTNLSSLSGLSTRHSCRRLQLLGHRLGDA